MINIPPEALIEYLKVNLFKEYDLSPKLREEHDREAEKKRMSNGRC
jgi:hypothetical protein